MYQVAADPLKAKQRLLNQRHSHKVTRGEKLRAPATACDLQCDVSGRGGHLFQVAHRIRDPRNLLRCLFQIVAIEVANLSPVKRNHSFGEVIEIDVYGSVSFAGCVLDCELE